jgi:hypothetical protein
VFADDGTFAALSGGVRHHEAHGVDEIVPMIEKGVTEYEGTMHFVVSSSDATAQGETVPVDRLREIEEIKQLKYRFLRCVDFKEFAALSDFLMDDVHWSSSGGAIKLEGRDAIVKWISDAMAPQSRLCSHIASHPEIVLTSDTEATGTWKFESITVLLDQDLTIRGSGFYRDQYTKSGGEWKYQAMGHELIFEESQPREALGIRLTASRWHTGGVQQLSSVTAGLPPVDS